MTFNPYDRYLGMTGDILEAEVVARFAPMTALQNMTIGADGTFILTSLLDGRLWRVSADGEVDLLTQIDGRPSGICPCPDGGWLVFGWQTSGSVAVFRVFDNGQSELFAEVPDAVFPNGGVRIQEGKYLFADSVTATVWLVNYHNRLVERWYSHPLLGPRPGEWAPALNGLQIWGGQLYMSNSSTRQLLALSMQGGWPVGEPDVVRDDIDMDDFAFDENGTIYSATHPFDVVLKLTQGGNLSRSAGPAEGVRGCTACQFGRTVGDERSIYVIADGGLFNPMSGGLQPAQLVRLHNSVAGAAPLIF